MKTLLAFTTGALFLPALAGGALARTTPDVHLATSIRALSYAPDAVRYAVTVRPTGGDARGTTLVLGTRRPAVWTAVAPGCLASGDRTAVACDLGDVRESESRTLRLTGRPGWSGPAGVPVVARVTAANAPTVTSSLGFVRRAVARTVAKDHGKAFVPVAGEVPSGQASADPAQSPPAESPAVESPAVESPAVQSPAVQSPAVQSPAVQSPAVQSPAAQAGPVGSPRVESPAAQPSESVPPAAHGVRPLGRTAREIGRPRPAPGPHRTPVAPSASAAPSPASPHVAAHGPPLAPIIPHVPIVPDLPGAAAPASPPPGLPAVPLPGASPPAALPQIATRPSPGEGVSELHMMSPAGAMQAGRASWAIVIAVAVVTEAGMLWLVAGFTVWRRRRQRTTGRRSRARSPRPLGSRSIP